MVSQNIETIEALSHMGFNFQRETTKMMLRLVETGFETLNFEPLKGGILKKKKKICEIHSKMGSWKSRIFDFWNPENDFQKS